MTHWGLLFAQDKGFGYFSNTKVTERIQDLQAFYRLPKWGLVIYRCTYGEEARWTRFMARLNTQLKSVLTEYYRTPELAESYDWDVQEDESLQGATKDEVRRRFRRWVDATSAAELPNGLNGVERDAVMRESPRYNYCVHVDLEALESVTTQPPVLGGPEGPMTGFVNLVRADGDWDLPDFDRFDWEAYEASKEEEVGEGGEGPGDGDDGDEYDEGEPEIEGSRLNDVGWMMVSATSLIPETYGTLMRGHTWDRLYCRPPKVLDW